MVEIATALVASFALGIVVAIGVCRVLAGRDDDARGDEMPAPDKAVFVALVRIETLPSTSQETVLRALQESLTGFPLPGRERLSARVARVG